MNLREQFDKELHREGSKWYHPTAAEWQVQEMFRDWLCERLSELQGENELLRGANVIFQEAIRTQSARTLTLKRAYAEQVEKLIGNHDELNHDAPYEIETCPKCQARKFLSPPQEDKP